MSDTNTTPEATPAGTPGTATLPPNGGRRHHRRRRWFAVGLATLIGLVGFGVGRATSHWSHWRGGGMGMHGMHGPMDADALGRRVDFGVGRMLAQVDGTTEQKAKVGEIAKAAIKDLFPLRAQLTEARGKLATALKAETLDRTKIEQLRTEQLALMDTASKRAGQALADAAEVLSPAQRAKLVERWQSRFGPG